MRLIFQGELHPELVGLFIALCPGTPNTRPLARVEHPHLDCCRVSVDGHFATKGVNFANDMSLGQSADRRVTTHLANGIKIHRQEERLCTHPGRG